MSVQTTADDRLEDAANAVSLAVKALSDIVIDEVYGSDEFNKGTQGFILDTFQELANLKCHPVMRMYHGRTGRQIYTESGRR